MKITEIDRATHKYIAKRVIESLDALGKELGLEFTYDRGMFSRTTYGDVKIKFAMISAPAVASAAKAGVFAPTAETQAVVEFRQNATTWGLSPSDLGREFTFQRNRYRIVGANTKAWKNPIKIERCSDGRGFNINPKYIVEAVKAAAPVTPPAPPPVAASAAPPEPFKPISKQHGIF